MKIKIPPYPNYKLADTLHSHIETDFGVKPNDNGGFMSTQLFFLMKFKSGRMKMVHCRPVEHAGKVYATAFPNPVHLFLSQGIENYYSSEHVKSTDFPKCGQEMEGPDGRKIYFLDIEEDGTHDCYNKYVQYRISSIIMIVAALEAFINHMIPNDFIYKGIKGNKEKEYNKDDIESTKFSFWKKLILVIPQYLKQESFWDSHPEERKNIMELYNHRTSVIHLKTNSEHGYKMYINSMDKVLDFDILSAINSSISFMNLIQSNFIEYEIISKK